MSVLTVLSMVVILIVLGCFMEQIAMMLLTLPFFVQLAKSMNLDMFWLSVILLIALLVGLMHPPFGLLLFVMRAVAPPEITLKQIWISTNSIRDHSARCPGTDDLRAVDCDRPHTIKKRRQNGDQERWPEKPGECPVEHLSPLHSGR